MKSEQSTHGIVACCLDATHLQCRSGGVENCVVGSGDGVGITPFASKHLCCPKGLTGATPVGQHLWARGYWVATSGNVTDEVWKEYIKNQTPPEPDDDFTVV